MRQTFLPGTSPPFYAPPGSIVTVTPDSATVTYTTEADSAVRNGVATFATLPLESGQQYIKDGMWIRVTHTSSVTVDVDENPSPAALKRWVGDYGEDGSLIDAAAAGLPPSVWGSDVSVNALAAYVGAAVPYLISTTATTAEAQAILDAADTDRRPVLFAAGTHVARDTLTLPAPYFDIRGMGKRITTLTPNASGDHVFQFVSGAVTNGSNLSDLQIVGGSDGTGSGIHQPNAGSTVVTRCTFARLHFDSLGGSGIKSNTTEFFSNTILDCSADNCLSHQFDIFNGLQNNFIGCYAQNCPTAGTAGYRVHSGNPLFMGCNGLDSGDYWGVFGDSVALDGAARSCIPSLHNCNVEDFEVAGLVNRNDAMNLHSVTMISAPSITGVIAMLFQGQVTHQGVAMGVRWALGSGSTWANSQPIHARAAPPPFALFVSDDAAAPSWQYYDDQNTDTATVSALTMYNASYMTQALRTHTMMASASMYTPIMRLTDGVAAPATQSGQALIYVDTADGDLKVKFGDGTVKVIAADT